MDLYERIFEVTADALFVAEADTGRVVAANPAAADLVGRSREDIVDAHFSEFHPDAQDSKYEQLFRDVLTEGRVTTEQLHVLTASGDRVPVEMNASVVNIDGRRLIQGSFRDVSDRRELESQLREERERYRRIFTSSNDAIFVVDPDANEVLDCNERACEMLGYDHGELVGMPISKIHPGEMSKFQTFASEVFEEGEGWTDELTCLTRDGTRLPSIMAASTIEWDNDTAMLACVQDISEQRRRERMLEELQNTTQALLKTRAKEAIAELATDTLSRVLDTPYGTVWLRDGNGRYDVAAATEAAEREALPVVEDIEGFLSDTEEGNTGVTEAMPVSASELPVNCVLAVPIGDHGVLTIGVADNSPAEADRWFVEILGATVAAALDRADRERDLERTNEQLAILNKIVRHDIRNDAVVVMAEIERMQTILGDDSGHEVQSNLGRARDAARDIVELTDTVGDLIRVVTEDTSPDVDPIDLAEMVVRELDRARSVHPDATFEADVAARPTVSANGMLSSAFRNLLNNAVDHHDGDHPTVTVEVGVNDDEAFVQVADDGPGIPDDRKETVFGRNEQGLESNGVGLGLHLVDQIVTQFGGNVELTDSPSGGACFTVWLPAT